MALVNASIRAWDGEFVGIIGPSGCGKSTLLNIIAGLVAPTEGRAYVHGASVVGRRGHSSYMPQGDHLLPWRNVLDNATLALEVDCVPRREARQRAHALLARFGLQDFERSMPQELSGGMRQRVAFIRTVLFQRDILLLDEPLGALDAQTRLLLQEWLLDVWSADKKTVVFVTHDVDEVTFLCDRVYVMSARPGRILNEIIVDLDRPRLPSIRTAPEFLAIRKRLLETVHHEAERAAFHMDR